jgi:hypothetical protein
LVAVVGIDRPQCGKLCSGRPDLLLGRDHAERHDAILCYRDLTRLFWPSAFDAQTNPFAEYTPEDFAQLRRFLGPDLRLAVIEPPDVTVKELHRRATEHGMEQARAEGRPPGRPSVIGERLGELILSDRQHGLSLGRIAERYGLPKSTVQGFLERIGV